MNGFLWTAVAFALAGLLAIIASNFWGTFRTTAPPRFRPGRRRVVPPGPERSNRCGTRRHRVRRCSHLIVGRRRPRLPAQRHRPTCQQHSPHAGYLNALADYVLLGLIEEAIEWRACRSARIPPNSPGCWPTDLRKRSVNSRCRRAAHGGVSSRSAACSGRRKTLVAETLVAGGGISKESHVSMLRW